MWPLSQHLDIPICMCSQTRSSLDLFHQFLCQVVPPLCLTQTLCSHPCYPILPQILSSFLPTPGKSFAVEAGCHAQTTEVLCSSERPGTMDQPRDSKGLPATLGELLVFRKWGLAQGPGGCAENHSFPLPLLLPSPWPNHWSGPALCAKLCRKTEIWNQEGVRVPTFRLLHYFCPQNTAGVCV